MHVDEFIDRYSPITKFESEDEREAERYARFVLSILRLPAALRLDFERFTPKLYCTWRRKRYLVVHASHLGYVGLAEITTDDGAILESASAADCSNWSSLP